MTETPPLCENCALARLPGYESPDHRCAQPADIPLAGSRSGVLLARRCGCTAGCKEQA